MDLDVKKIGIKEIAFYNATIAHPDSESGVTVADVAEALERRYKIYQNFAKSNMTEIGSIIKANLIERFEMGRKFHWKARISGQIMSEFRQYMLAEEHGIKTRSSVAENRKSFIKTNSYVKFTKIKVK